MHCLSWEASLAFGGEQARLSRRSTLQATAKSAALCEKCTLQGESSFREGSRTLQFQAQAILVTEQVIFNFLFS